MNILQKIKACALQNNEVLEISGSKKTKVFFGKSLSNPYKIITGKKWFFDKLCAQLVQTKECVFNSGFGTDYTAYFTEGDFKVVIQKQMNGYDLIMIFKV
jgi:hypothetical protein